MTRQELKHRMSMLLSKYNINISYQGSIEKIDTKHQRVDMCCYSSLITATNKFNHEENIGTISEVEPNKYFMFGDQGLGFDFLTQDQIDNAEGIIEQYAKTPIKNRDRASYNTYKIPDGKKTLYQRIFHHKHATDK